MIANVISESQSFKTWVPTWSGFSSDPTGIFRYKLDIANKQCFISFIRSANGSSNAGATTVTLPAVAANTDKQIIPVQIISNGAAQAGYIATRANSNIADLKLINGTDPSNVGAKSIQGNGWFETT